MTKRWGTGTFVIPAPLEVDALMKRVPRGRVVTINELRAVLAAKHKADFGLPDYHRHFFMDSRARRPPRLKRRAKNASRPTGARSKPAVN